MNENTRSLQSEIATNTQPYKISFNIEPYAQSQLTIQNQRNNYGVPIGTPAQRWSNIYYNNLNCPQPSFPICCVEDGIDPTTFTAAFHAYYYMKYNATIGLRAFYRWNGSAYVNYTPEEGETFCSVSSNNARRFRLITYALGQILQSPFGTLVP